MADPVIGAVVWTHCLYAASFPCPSSVAVTSPVLAIPVAVAIVGTT